VRPTSVAETVEALAAARGRVRIIGGGTTARPVDGAETLALDGLSGVLEVRPADLVASARAGTTLGALDDALREHGRRLPLAPHDTGRGTIGGAFAAGADGLRARMGFRLRDVVLATTAVLPGGDVVRVGAAVVKSVAGFGVARALVGAGGSLAALAEVTFRIETRPAARSTAGAAFASRDDALARARRALRSAHTPSAVAVRSEGDDHRVAVLFEGTPGAVRAAAAHAKRHGLPEIPPPWDEWTGDAAGPAGGSRARVSGSDARVPPAPFALIDVQRGRFVAHTEGPVAAAEVHPLFTRLRSAFDPERRLVSERMP